MNKVVKRVLFSQEEIAERCKQLAKQIDKDYENNPHNLLVVGTLKGALPFMAELIKNITLDIEIDFIAASSYDGTESLGDIRILKDLDCSIKDRDILLVEDIVDTGLTIKKLKELLYHKGAYDVKVVTLLNKEGRRTEDAAANYVGFEIENEFVIGFGLDYNQKYRNLPYVAVFDEKYI